MDDQTDKVSYRVDIKLYKKRKKNFINHLKHKSFVKDKYQSANHRPKFKLSILNSSLTDKLTKEIIELFRY